MLLPKGGVNWKSAKSKLPAWRALIVFLMRARVLAVIAMTVVFVMLWRVISDSTEVMSK